MGVCWGGFALLTTLDWLSGLKMMAELYGIEALTTIGLARSFVLHSMAVSRIVGGWNGSPRDTPLCYRARISTLAKAPGEI